MSEYTPMPKVHDVEVKSVLGGSSNWFAVCSCGWSTGAPEEKGVSEDEIRRRVREHRKV
jgi:hypothetical protein